MGKLYVITGDDEFAVKERSRALAAELAGGARLPAASPPPEVTALAGDGAVLVSRFKSTKPVSVVFEGGMPERMQVHLLDREHDLEPVAAEPAGNVLALPGEGSAVWLIATA